jgi:hypothetical protein
MSAAGGRRLAIALVHHPILDAKGGTTTSTLTSLDLHDLARSARTYGCSDFFIVHPIEAQRTLAKRIVDHWTHGSSAKRIPDRKDALALVRIVETLTEAEDTLESERWVTAAKARENATTFADAKAALASEGPPVLVVFGTGWGLADSVMTSAARILEPIRGPEAWNHLSVRAACAITLDRLRGVRG